MAHRTVDERLSIYAPLTDATTPDFVETVRSQAACLRKAPEEAKALDFIEAAADLEGWAG